MTRTPRSDPGTRRLGVGMVIAAWAIVIAALTAYFGDWLSVRENPNQSVGGSIGPDGAREVVLRQNHRGHYVANGEINDLPVTFLLDTGATDVSIPAGVARRIGLRAGAARRARTANGTIVTYATRLDRVSLGSISLAGVSAHINPHMQGDEVLLGMSFLRELELVQRGEQLTLRQRSGDS